MSEMIETSLKSISSRSSSPSTCLSSSSKVSSRSHSKSPETVPGMLDKNLDAELLKLNLTEDVSCCDTIELNNNLNVSKRLTTLTLLRDLYSLPNVNQVLIFFVSFKTLFWINFLLFWMKRMSQKPRAAMKIPAWKITWKCCQMAKVRKTAFYWHGKSVISSYPMELSWYTKRSLRIQQQDIFKFITSWEEKSNTSRQESFAWTIPEETVP